jgi:hypothetical protein
MILRLFAKLWIATIGLVMPVLPFPWNNLATTEWNFMIFYWEFFQSLSGKNSSLTSIKGNGYMMKSCIFMIKSHWICFRIKYVLDKILEEVKAHNMLNNIFPNIVPFVKQCGKIWWSQRGCRERIIRWHIVCWITKATDTLWEYLTFIAFPRQQLWYELASLLVYMYIASLVCFCEGFGGVGELGLPYSSRLCYRCQAT